MKSTLFMIFLVGMIVYNQAHRLEIGTCQSVEPMQGFDPKKFLGTWYIIQVFDPMNKCLTMTFEEKDETRLTVTQFREMYVLNMLSVNNRIGNEGTLEMNQDQPSSMKVRWGTTFWLGSAEFMVMDTDYTTYAALFECKEFWLARRSSGAILSRTPSLDQRLIDELKMKFAAFGVEEENFEPVSHSNCLEEGQGEVELKVDENTFF